MTTAGSRRLPVVFMFTGQGSQYYQMGRELYEGHPVFREVLERCDRIVHQRAGFSVIAKIMAGARSDTFDDLQATHPALVAIEFAMYETLIGEGVVPDALLGSSLGELVAAAIAGYCSYEAALAFAVEHARSVAGACPPGGMLAVLAPREQWDGLQGLDRNLTMVGENFPGHFTVSGPAHSLERLESELKRRNVTFVRLPVRYAFHSPAVESSHAGFMRAGEALGFSTGARLPVVSTMMAGRIPEFSLEYFSRVVQGPIRFRDTIARLEAEGPSLFVDCGPAGTAAAFVKYNLSPDSASRQFPILSPFGNGLRSLEKALVELRQASAQRVAGAGVVG